ncbi:MAG: hypothetical protein PHI84_01540 [Kiritimatiellae bacterium]|nr:hypothetical protein [Kiritimatiellia bacterium]
MSSSSNAPYEVRATEAGDYYVVLPSANLIFQRGLTKQEANRIVEIMNHDAKEDMALAEKSKVEALEKIGVEKN